MGAGEQSPTRGTSVPSAAGSFCPGPTWWPSPGTSITNHSFEGLLALVRAPGAYVIMLGDSVAVFADFFSIRRGRPVRLPGGDEELALRCVSQGANFGR